MAELRQIRTLRLRASRREQVARSAIALEDALRTASLPQMPRGAILLVRRLDLGRLSADASPQWLSRHIETRLQALQLPPARPRHDAPSAELVWFADRSEALAVLLATSLHGAPRAWYWAGVLPGWRPGMTFRELLPRALRQAEAEPRAAAGVAGVAALLDRLLRLRPAGPGPGASRAAPSRATDRLGKRARRDGPVDAVTAARHRRSTPGVWQAVGGRKGPTAAARDRVADRERCLAARADQMVPAMGCCRSAQPLAGRACAGRGARARRGGACRPADRASYRTCSRAPGGPDPGSDRSARPSIFRKGADHPAARSADGGPCR